jgi:imidazolonepropionase
LRARAPSRGGHRRRRAHDAARAHALPPEFAGRPDDYIDLVCGEIIPAAALAARRGRGRRILRHDRVHSRADAAVFEAARSHGLRVKLHADQLSDTGGAALAAEFGALSADHIEYTSDAGVEAMARAGTVAVLLPGAFYALRETRLPPIARCVRKACRWPIASDCNPGTSPATSLPLMLNMACTLFRSRPPRRSAGVTRHAARVRWAAPIAARSPSGSAPTSRCGTSCCPPSFCYGSAATPAAVSFANGQVASIQPQ